MPKPTVQQRQQYYSELNELLIQRIYASVSDQIAQKRWEFQHSDIDPNRLWNIANEVEALNWVFEKNPVGVPDNRNRVPGFSLKSLIASLMRGPVRIDKCLLEFKTEKQKSYEYYRLKSRATIVEWSLFQIHFIAADGRGEDLDLT